ncbi:hypothetical protein JCM17478_09820 [Thermopirellula anaerolimosa]
MTLFTTIMVATPSITLMMDAKAIYRVRKYRQQSIKTYIADRSSVTLKYRFDRGNAPQGRTAAGTLPAKGLFRAATPRGGRAETE